MVFGATTGNTVFVFHDGNSREQGLVDRSNLGLALERTGAFDCTIHLLACAFLSTIRFPSFLKMRPSMVIVGHVDDSAQGEVAMFLRYLAQKNIPLVFVDFGQASDADLELRSNWPDSPMFSLDAGLEHLCEYIADALSPRLLAVGE